MSELWQTIIVFAILLAACAYIARAAWRTVVAKKSAGCGSGCSSCPSNASSATNATSTGGFVAIDELLSGGNSRTSAHGPAR